MSRVNMSEGKYVRREICTCMSGGEICQGGNMSGGNMYVCQGAKYVRGKYVRGKYVRGGEYMYVRGISRGSFLLYTP